MRKVSVLKKSQGKKKTQYLSPTLNKNTILFHFSWKPSAQLRITARSLYPQRLATNLKEKE